MKLIRRIILAACCYCCFHFECLQACLGRQQTATVAIYDPRSGICLNFIGVFVWTCSYCRVSLSLSLFFFDCWLFFHYFSAILVIQNCAVVVVVVCCIIQRRCFSSRVCRVWSGQPTWKALQQRRHENSSNQQMIMQTKKSYKQK